jgi:23S rRNA pseudouridine955/2504/2580 synthase
MKHELEIGRPDAGRKIERVVAAALDAAPYALVRRLLRNGKIRINGTKAKGGEVVAEGDVVIIHHAAQEGAKGEATPTAPYAGPAIGILYRTADYLALNKPAGVSCSEDDRPQWSVQAWLRASLASEIESGGIRPELCHRLDRGTTGVVMVALNAAASTRFHGASEEERPQKSYRVLAWGVAPTGRWTVERSLLRMPQAAARAPKTICVESGVEGAKDARTEFTTLAQGADACLLSARLLTGRTHQIRAHLLGEGLPIVGDRRYGNRDLDRQFGLAQKLDHQALHAEELSFQDAGGRQTIRAPRPPEFLGAMLRLSLEPA